MANVKVFADKQTDTDKRTSQKLYAGGIKNMYHLTHILFVKYSKNDLKFCWLGVLDLWRKC